jgi:hypothetical protein
MLNGKSLGFLACFISGLLWVDVVNAQSPNNELNDPSMIFAKHHLIAWCIVPYDVLERDAEQRMRMLNRLGITKYAWDWRQKHLATLPIELREAENHDIEVSAIWFWIDQRVEDSLTVEHEKIIEDIIQAKLQTALWISFDAAFFNDLNQEQKIEKAVKVLRLVRSKVDHMGIKLALYNHGEWFGNPLNQLAILDHLGDSTIGMIYNFHHAHDQIDNYDTYIRAALPKLWVVNLNGMRLHSDKIMPLGSGDLEKRMIKTLVDLGYQGKIGILGHVEDEDVEVVLRRNIDGLKTILEALNYTEPLKTYR